MAKLLKLRRGTTSQHSSFTGAEGEVTVNTDNDSLVVHDGSTAGGHELLRKDLSNAPAGVIDNADISSSANIAGTKISPNFGSQTITTTGNTNLDGDVTLGGTRPRLNFYDSSDNPDFAFIMDGGMFQVFDQTNGANRVQINSNGHVDVLNHLDVNNGLDVSGATTLTSTGTTNPVTITGSGGHELYAYHDSGGCGWATGAGGSYGELLYLDENGSTTRLYAAQGERFRAKSGGCEVTGLLEVSAGMNLTGALTGDRAVFQDDGTAGPTVSIMTDDNSPWALSIGNDTYSTQSHKGLMFYQNNDGTMYQHFRGIGSYESIYFQSSDGSSTQNFMYVDANRAVHLEYQDATKISTASTGVQIASTNDLRIAAGTWAGEYSGGIKIQPDPNNSYFQFQGVLFFRDETGANRLYLQQNGQLGIGNDALPNSDDSYDLGSPAKRWRNIYTGDLHLSNKGHTNDVDGSWGNWTIQEGESDLFLKNNRSGKTYKFNLTEVN